MEENTDFNANCSFLMTKDNILSSVEMTYGTL